MPPRGEGGGGVGCVTALPPQRCSVVQKGISFPQMVFLYPLCPPPPCHGWLTWQAAPQAKLGCDGVLPCGGGHGWAPTRGEVLGYPLGSPAPPPPSYQGVHLATPFSPLVPTCFTGNASFLHAALKIMASAVSRHPRALHPGCPAP